MLRRAVWLCLGLAVSGWSGTACNSPEKPVEEEPADSGLDADGDTGTDDVADSGADRAADGGDGGDEPGDTPADGDTDYTTNITDPRVTTGRTYEWDVLRTGKLQYLDRGYVFFGVPAKYSGMPYLKTANDDKQATGDPFLTFDVDRAVTVYVAHDDRIATKPGWLGAWSDTGDDLVSETTFSLFARDFAAGQVSIGGNGGGSEHSMYSVVVETGDPDPHLENVFDVKDYGAAGDGTTLDTDAINAAIEAASADGGGTVHLPAGTYRSGSIILKDNVVLNLHANAIIKATMSHDYSSVDPNPWDAYQDWGHSHWKSALIWGVGVDNVGITGSGLIDGSDAAGGTGLEKGTPPEGFADRAISFKDCNGVLIKDVTIHRAGHFAIIATGCTGVTIDNVVIDTNRDGINIDCCSDVEITHSVVNSPQDDAIVLKSSYALGYLRPTENVTINKCAVLGNRVGSLLPQFPDGSEGWQAGRIKFGTESNGGFRNITIQNCHFESCYGFLLATVDGAHIEDIYIDNIRMYNLVSEPIFLRLGDRARGPGPPPPGSVRNVNFSNITADADHGGASCIISGIPGHRIENVNLTNVQVDYPGGGTTADARIVLPENESGHPDAFMFGQTTPCYGFYLRHVDGVTFDDCRFDVDSPDARPKYTLIDALNADTGP